MQSAIVRQANLHGIDIASPTNSANIEKKASRETRRISNAFGKLLEAIGEDGDRSPQLTRAAIYEPDPNAAWVTKQIQIRVKQ